MDLARSPRIYSGQVHVPILYRSRLRCYNVRLRPSRNNTCVIRLGVVANARVAILIYIVIVLEHVHEILSLELTLISTIPRRLVKFNSCQLAIWVTYSSTDILPPVLLHVSGEILKLIEPYWQFEIL